MSSIIATGKYAPELAATNFDLEKMIDTSDEWIYTRTGIKERRVSQDETTLDLAYNAALDAINSYDIDVTTIDLIIVATISPDYFTPSTASLLQSKLGLNDKGVTAFDVNAACTGFIYGIQIADKFIRSGSHKRALVIGAETLSKITDWEDRSTCILFGDGAGAVILSGEEDKILCTYTNSAGDESLNLACPALPLDTPFTTKKGESSSYLSMEGKEIFRFSVYAVEDAISYALANSDLSIDDIDYIVPHQANERIIAKIARVMKIPLEKFYLNLKHYGNTSSASVGMALDDLYKTTELKTGDKILLVGFGGGLTWGAILFEY